MTDHRISVPKWRVDEWLDRLRGVTFFGREVHKMRRDELLVVVGFYAAMEKTEPRSLLSKPQLVPQLGFTYTVIGGNL